MHNILQRLNAVSALATTTIMCLAAAIALTSLIMPTPAVSANIQVPRVKVIWGRDERDYYDRREREWAHVRFDVRADLSPLFDWNTKQLFVYLTADYASPGYPGNRVVVWDRIVRRKGDAKVNIAGARNKYAFKEIGGSFKDLTANFTLHYNAMPHVGALKWGEAGVTSRQVVFPPSKRTVG